MNSKLKAENNEGKKFLNHILKNLPAKPGVYRFKDAKGKVIYVGKAINLKNRVSSYFKNEKNASSKTIKLVSQIKDLDYTIVDSELEAILLETNLIKELQPKYNILMKDDKNFVYLKITVNEDYPRILITRKVEKDKALYFGPKTARFKLEKTLKILKKIFPYRHCQLEIIDDQKQNSSIKSQQQPTASKRRKVIVKKAGIKYPCIDYHIKRCVAPCIGMISPEEYRKIINRVIEFFSGKHDQIIKNLKADMQRAAAEKKFELAASIRDKLTAIEDIMEKQTITAPDHQNLDVINYFTTDERFFFNLFQVRGGKLINQENFELNAKNPITPDQKEVLSNFIQQYYEKTTDLPDQILIPHESGHDELFETWLSGVKGKKIRIIVPERGRKDKLLELSFKNAENYAKLSEVKWQGHIKSTREKAIAECMVLLKLPRPPKRMECYDISHIGGTETVASMVVFENGFPKKDDYRKFKLHINTPGSPDDYASMKEVLSRRLKHLKSSNQERKIRIAKLSTKEKTSLNIELKTKDNSSNELLKITSNKIIIGFIKIFTDKNSRRLVEIIKNNNTDFIHELATQLTKRLKAKKLYFRLNEQYISDFETAGFQAVKKIPDTFTKNRGETILMFLPFKFQTDSSLNKNPDLIIIDGGKGQLNIARKELALQNMEIPLISIAKQNEEIYLADSKNPVIYPKDHPLLNMIRHIRDESHRFAVSYQQNLKLKSTKQSELDEIFGVGDSAKLKLLKQFGSVSGVKNATLYELQQIVGKQKAIKIKNGLK